MRTFETDKLLGSSAEDELELYLESEGKVVERAPDKYFPDWDLRCDGVTYEVKLDTLWPQTGRVAIEQKALQHSKADYFVYKLKGGKGLYMLPRYMVDQLYRKGRVTTGGDQNHPISVIGVPIFLRYSTKLSKHT